MPIPRRITTRRLWLRPFEGRDTDRLHELWILPDVRRYLWDDIAIEREVAEEVVVASAASFDAQGYGFFVVFEQGSDTMVGFCGLRDYEDPRHGGLARPEVLYGLDPDFWRRGYASEAAVAALRFGFEACELPRIDAGVDPPNARSRRILDGLGFTNWERLEIGGQPADYAALDRSAFLASDAFAAAYDCDLGPR